MLGGTYEENNSDLVVNTDLDVDIVRRCSEMEPRLMNARRLTAATGLRPARSAVRLERELASDGTPIVHNYGHGGGGVTLSWGYADDVVALVV